MSIRFRVRSRSKRSPTHVDGSAESRGCKVCAPLREKRRLKKAQRKADAQAQAHAKGLPCGRTNCPVPVCVQARHADPATPAPARDDGESSGDSDVVRRRQAEKHRAGLPCGLETCPSQVCVEGFAQERGATGHGDRASRSNAPTPFAWRVAPTADPFGPCDLCERQRAGGTLTLTRIGGGRWASGSDGHRSAGERRDLLDRTHCGTDGGRLLERVAVADFIGEGPSCEGRHGVDHGRR